MSGEHYPTVEELTDRLLAILSRDSRFSVRATTTQVKLGRTALEEIVVLLETHAVAERGQA